MALSRPVQLGRLFPSARQQMATRHFTTPSHHHFLNPSLSSPSSSPLRPLLSIRGRRTLLTSKKTFTTTIFAAAASSMASAPAKKVLVPIANGTEPLGAVVIIDVLRRSGADVKVASTEKQLQVDASWGIKLVADSLVSDCAATNYDLIALPGGMPGAANFRDCGVLEEIVKKHAAVGGLYSALCAAPAVVLGPWGLLKGLKATCYPSHMEKLSSADAIAVDSRVVEDGKVVTSRGTGTAMEFAVALVEKLYGKDKAKEVARPLLMSPNQGDEFHMTELNSTEWKVSNPPQILVPIANGSEEMESVIIIDVLRRASANVVVASVEDKLEIVASRKVKLVADMLIGEAAKLEYDLILLPGGIPGAQTFSDSEVLVNILKRQAQSNKLYGAICASPALVFEPHGLLKGKKATAFPALCSKLFDQSEAENRVVVDGNLITSRGPGTSMEFSLAIVEKLFGREKALNLAKNLVFI